MARDGMEQAHQDLKKAKAELAAHAQTIAEQAARIKTLEVGGAEQIAATQSQVEVRPVDSTAHILRFSSTTRGAC